MDATNRGQSDWITLLATHAEPPEGFKSVREIAEECGLGERQVREKVAELLREGKVEMRMAKGKCGTMVKTNPHYKVKS